MFLRVRTEGLGKADGSLQGLRQSPAMTARILNQFTAADVTAVDVTAAAARVRDIFNAD